jgi:hypothetical protein
MAPNYANLALFLEIGMGLALLAGAMFARRKRFRLHACCQTIVVLLNFVVILLLMLPSFRVHVIPKIPAKLGEQYYAVATAHAALGSVTEAAALYIVLSAGTNLLPQKTPLHQLQALDAQSPRALVACTPVGPGNVCPVVCH